MYIIAESACVRCCLPTCLVVQIVRHALRTTSIYPVLHVPSDVSFKSTFILPNHFIVVLSLGLVSSTTSSYCLMQKAVRTAVPKPPKRFSRLSSLIATLSPLSLESTRKCHTMRISPVTYSCAEKKTYSPQQGQNLSDIWYSAYF